MSNPFQFFNPNSPSFPHLPHMPPLPPFPPLPELSWPFHPPYGIPALQPPLYGPPPNHPFYNPLLIQQQNNYFSPQFQHFQNQVQCSNPYLQKLLNSTPKAISSKQHQSKSTAIGKIEPIIEICDDSPTTKKEQLSKTIIKIQPRTKEGDRIQKKLKPNKNQVKHNTEHSLIQPNLTPAESNDYCSLRKTRVSGKIPKQLEDEDYQPQNQSSLAKMQIMNRSKCGQKNKTRYGGSPSFKLINFSTVVPAMMTQQDLSFWKENTKQNLKLRKMSP